MRRATAILVLGIAIAVAATAAPVPSGLAPPPYMPTVLGTKWVYDYYGDEQTEEITAVEKQDGVEVVTIERIVKKKYKEERRVKVAGDGLFQLTGGPAFNHTPMLLLKLPHRPGDSWETFTGAWGGGFGEVTALKAERVQVPAGRYDVVGVETKYPQRVGDAVVAKWWYARGVGLVKEMYGPKVQRELKSFTPGKG